MKYRGGPRLCLSLMDVGYLMTMGLWEKAKAGNPNAIAIYQKLMNAAIADGLDWHFPPTSWPEKEPPTTFTCPDCGMVSYNQNDLLYGYCGKCHEFKGETA